MGKNVSYMFLWLEESNLSPMLSQGTATLAQTHNRRQYSISPIVLRANIKY